MTGLEGQVTVVTGGNAGIGRAIAFALADAGATVVVADLDEAVMSTAVEIQSRGCPSLGVCCDVSDERQVAGMVRQVTDQFGAIDVLVNNVGIAGETANLVDVKLEDWNRVLAINLTGAMLCAREVVKGMMVRKSGNVIIMSSGAGKVGTPMRSPYCASKWALIGLTQTWALELGPFNIRVNAICPGFVAGDRVDRVFRAKAEASGTSYHEERGFKEKASPFGRLVTPEEVAEIAVFLASRASSCMTGQAINASAGVEMR